jgi:hypothetical protein
MSRDDWGRIPPLRHQRPNPGPLAAAVDAYPDRFGADALPDLAGCPDVEFAAWLLRDAVVRGVPLAGRAVLEGCRADTPPSEAA